MDEHAHLAPEDIFRLAILRSPYPAPDLSRRLGWSESYLRRVLSRDKYFPSYEDIPAFCRMVGNDLVLDWLKARTRLGKPIAPEVTSDYLRDQVIDLNIGLGEMAGRVRIALADAALTKKELRDILKDVLELNSLTLALAGALRDAEKKVSRPGAHAR